MYAIVGEPRFLYIGHGNVLKTQFWRRSHDPWKLTLEVYWATIYTRDEQDANPNRRHF